jgi:hypothetical protein
MFERFTDRARRVLVLAQEEARLLNHGFIGTEHILLGLIHEGEGVAAQVLEDLGLSLEAAREKVEETVGPVGSGQTGSPPFTPRAKKVLELSLREALQLGHNHIGTEHILLGLMREGEGVAVQVLLSFGADQLTVRKKVFELIGGSTELEEMSEPIGGAGLVKRRGARVAPVPVGREWFAQVVRAGRRPEDYAGAYGELAELASALGLRLEDVPSDEVTCVSIETSEGPGFLVSVKHRLDEELPSGPPAI